MSDAAGVRTLAADAWSGAPPSRSGWSGSILFPSGSGVSDGAPAEPDYFGDLNLGQVCEALTRQREEFRLEEFFYQPLQEVDAVQYRHAVLLDLERDEISQALYAFAEQLRQMRRQLALVDKLRDRHQRERWFLAAVSLYAQAVAGLDGRLQTLELGSPAMRGFSSYLRGYAGSAAFSELTSDTARLQAELDAIRYSIKVSNLRIEVSPYEEMPDLTDQIERTFAKFRQGAVDDHRFKFREEIETDTVEARILAVLASVFPAEFAHAASYLAARRKSFLDSTVARFDREVQFYFAYLELIKPLKAAGLRFSYPAVSSSEKAMHASGSFDLALALKLVADDKPVVVNDVALAGAERVIVVSGPNQGGKTTFARMFGQLHHLAALGLPVPGDGVAAYLPDRLFTHFEREEDVNTLRGKFEDELVRLHAILERATGRSVLILNESFSSTTLDDARWVGERILGAVIERDMICLCVTFIDELSSLHDSVVSMMSTVDPGDPARRTFAVVRKPADGLAYAVALAIKHGISYEQLRGRLAR
ncbi:MAG: DNA mismatch repair protein MutS [Actinomycetota bacterium]|nr:DNA mismatch repair protein MutS [Actinomycetota bacterium]